VISADACPFCLVEVRPRRESEVCVLFSLFVILLNIPSLFNNRAGGGVSSGYPSPLSVCRMADSSVRRLPSGERVPCIILANKVDIAPISDERRQELDRFAQRHEILAWFETSAKKDTGIDTAMSFLTEHLLRRQSDVRWPVDHSSFRLTPLPTPVQSITEKEKGCCGKGSD
jgi:Ras family